MGSDEFLARKFYYFALICGYTLAVLAIFTRVSSEPRCRFSFDIYLQPVYGVAREKNEFSMASDLRAPVQQLCVRLSAAIGLEKLCGGSSARNRVYVI